MENRKKRVRRLKIIMVESLLILLLIPLIISVFLLIKVNRLEERMGLLEEILLQSGSPQKDNGDEVREASENGEVTGGKDFAEREQQQSDEELWAGMRRVYLTFDDGPSPNTQNILDILAEYEVQATFFVTAMYAPKYDEYYSRIVEEGHSLGIHSYSHVYSEIYASLENFREDFAKMQNYVYELTGKQCILYRFPGGSSNRVSATPVKELISWLNEEGIIYYDWNVSGRDSESSYLLPEEIAANCLRGIEKCGKDETVIVLLHDAAGKKSTVEALPLIIDGIRQMEDTVLLPVSEGTMPVQHISITKE